MKLLEAVKSGRRFKPTEESCHDWCGDWASVTYAKNGGEPRITTDMDVGNFWVNWLEWDWELEPEEVGEVPKPLLGIVEGMNILEKLNALQLSNIELSNRLLKLEIK